MIFEFPSRSDLAEIRSIRHRIHSRIDNLRRLTKDKIAKSLQNVIENVVSFENIALIHEFDGPQTYETNVSRTTLEVLQVPSVRTKK